MQWEELKPYPIEYAFNYSLILKKEIVNHHHGCIFNNFEQNNQIFPAVFKPISNFFEIFKGNENIINCLKKTKTVQIRDLSNYGI
jgi:hypothetical protein